MSSLRGAGPTARMSPTTRAVRVAAAAVLAVGLLTACGQGGTDGEPVTPLPWTGGPVTTPPAPPGAGQPDPTGQPGSVPPAKETTGPGAGAPGGPKVLTGTVTAGVEPNCLLLDGYLLIGGPPDVLRVGARVVVTGDVQADVVTTCMQGTPFLVARARLA